MGIMGSNFVDIHRIYGLFAKIKMVRDKTLMQGNEVTTLVKEEKPAGEYKVEFDATLLTSGIYFYQLSSKGFIQTKKMVYLK
jgi:hypothetical protein